MQRLFLLPWAMYSWRAEAGVYYIIIVTSQFGIRYFKMSLGMVWSRRFGHCLLSTVKMYLTVSLRGLVFCY